MNSASATVHTGSEVPSFSSLGRPADALLHSLHTQGVPCWLDSGTLLGICREGHPPAWDKDIDLAMWQEDLDRARPLLFSFSRAWGYNMQEKWLEGVPYAIVFKLGMALEQRPDGVFIRIKELPVNIHLFSRNGEWAESAQPHYLLAQNTVYARFRLGKLAHRQVPVPPLPWVKRFRYACVHMAGRMKLYSFLKPLLRRLEKPDADSRVRVHPSERTGLGWLFEKFVWKVPRKYFMHFDTPAGFPEFVKIPADYDAYLTARYGQWRQPTQDWLYMIDDGLLQPKSPGQKLSGQKLSTMRP